MHGPLFDIWLSLVCGPGSPVPKALLEEFSSAESVFYDSDKERLASVKGVTPSLAASIKLKDISRAEEILGYCINNNVSMITMSDKRYPDKLRRIENPPALLYCKGSLPDFDNIASVAVVGTRKASPTSRKAAYTISRDLVLAGACVVSGMALGIDGAAAAGALDAGGHTVAVLGCGIDVVYPPQHEFLMDRIIVGGAVVTELPPHSVPAGRNFPVRNRIISGLSDGTLVVAGSFDSGALITARRAGEQGRTLFAVPGDINVPESEGPNSLIKDGAVVVTSAEDVVMEYASIYPHTLDVNRMRRLRRELLGNGGDRQSAFKVAASRVPDFYGGYVDEKTRKNNGSEEPDAGVLRKERAGNSGKAEKSSKTVDDGISLADAKKAGPKNGKDNEKLLLERIAALGERERRVYDAMPDDMAVNSDELAASGIPVSDVLVGLTMLEVAGLAEAMPGGLFKKKT